MRSVRCSILATASSDCSEQAVRLARTGQIVIERNRVRALGDLTKGVPRYNWGDVTGSSPATSLA